MTTAIFIMEPSTWFLPHGPVVHSDSHISVTVPAGVWAIQRTTGESPPPLCFHTFTKIDHHRAVVFGGYTGSSRENDAYVLDMETWVCRCMCLYILICLFCTYCLAAGDHEWKHCEGQLQREAMWVVG